MGHLKSTVISSGRFQARHSRRAEQMLIDRSRVDIREMPQRRTMLETMADTAIQQLMNEPHLSKQVKHVHFMATVTKAGNTEPASIAFVSKFLDKRRASIYLSQRDCNHRLWILPINEFAIPCFSLLFAYLAKK
jgi:hypothetical protein